MLGENVRRLREARAMSQAELGALVGTNQSMISQVELGSTKPSYDRLVALARVLGVSLDDLTGVRENSAVN